MLARVFKSGHSGATFGGIGTLDMAIWDLKAKAAGEPLWRLLGARDRFVTGYASGLDIALDDEQLAAWYRSMGERGFTSGKLKGGRDVTADIRRLGIIADALAVNTAEAGASCSTRTSRGTSSRPCATSARSSGNSTSPGSRSRFADGMPRATPGSPARSAPPSPPVRISPGSSSTLPCSTPEPSTSCRPASVWGVSHFLRVAYAAHSRDLPVSPVGLSANPIGRRRGRRGANHLSAEVQDLGTPFGITIDQEIADGGIVLGDSPGNGVTVDEAAIEHDQRSGTWVAAGGSTRPLAPRRSAAGRRWPRGDGRLSALRARADHLHPLGTLAT